MTWRAVLPRLATRFRKRARLSEASKNGGESVS